MKRLSLAVLAVAGAAAGVLAGRRLLSRATERIDLYFEDGSMQSLSNGAPEAARLLPLARAALNAARGG